MHSVVRSPLTSALAGGIVVAGVFLVLGITGRRSTETVIQQAPMAAQPAASSSSALTPHAIYVRDAPAVVFLRATGRRGSTGSGFLVDRRGDFLTSYDVIAGTDAVTVQFVDGVVRRAAVVGQDPDEDVALLHVSMRGLPPVQPLPLGESSSVRVGDPTLAIANPFGYDRTLSSGIVAALQGKIRTPHGASVANVIQTDTPVSPGSAGGPLLDADGRVVGITGFGGAISFAIPIDTAKALLERVR
jgi:putative serine protease PepD